MSDDECVRFLQWALPRLHMRWPGFRKVRGQICKRLRRRIAALGLPDLEAYRAFLERTPSEWQPLAALCRVTITRFWRDRRVFDLLTRLVLPQLAEAARAAGEPRLATWCAGCASGEEVWSLRLAWDLGVRAAGVGLDLLGTDIDPALLERAQRGCYPPGVLRELDPEWRAVAFAPRGDERCLEPRFRHDVRFAAGDLREESPLGRFDLVLCRNLAFTYFDDALQRRVLDRILERLRPGGVLVVGRQEQPPDDPRLAAWLPAERVYRLVG